MLAQHLCGVRQRLGVIEPDVADLVIIESLEGGTELGEPFLAPREIALPQYREEWMLGDRGNECPWCDESARLSAPFWFQVNIENVGLNIAENIVAYNTLEGNQTGRGFDYTRSVLAVGAKSAAYGIELDSTPGRREIVCQYKNLWGDKYEVRAPLELDERRRYYVSNMETFRVIEAGED